jgi:hypothetical protein
LSQSSSLWTSGTEQLPFDGVLSSAIVGLKKALAVSLINLSHELANLGDELTQLYRLFETHSVVDLLQDVALIVARDKHEADAMILALLRQRERGTDAKD